MESITTLIDHLSYGRLTAMKDAAIKQLHAQHKSCVNEGVGLYEMLKCVDYIWSSKERRFAEYEKFADCLGYFNTYNEITACLIQYLQSEIFSDKEFFVLLDILTGKIDIETVDIDLKERFFRYFSFLEIGYSEN